MNKLAVNKLAAAVGVVVLSAAAGCGGTTAGHPVAGAGGPAETSTQATQTTAPPASGTTGRQPTTRPGGNDVLGPSGWGPVTIGMDRAAAAATGVFTDTPEPAGTCAEWPAALASPIESVIVSPKVGVAAIIARAGVVVHTPEGVKIGSTADEVHAAYPEFDVDDVDTPNGPVIAAPGNPVAAYRLSFDAGTVVYLVLESVNQDCYG